jgi:hypothetical protein
VPFDHGFFQDQLAPLAGIVEDAFCTIAPKGLLEAED